MNVSHWCYSYAMTKIMELEDVFAEARALLLMHYGFDIMDPENESTTHWAERIFAHGFLLGHKQATNSILGEWSR